MLLSQAKTDKTYNVIGISLPEDITRRLQVLGFTMGTSITVENRNFNGAVIFRIRGARYALGKKYADGITLNDASEVKDFSNGIKAGEKK